MKIVTKLAAKAKDNWNQPGVTVAFLGDSVTQGCFEVYQIAPEKLETVFDKNHAYHADFARILTVLYPNVPVNIINAGISGGSAPHAAERLERDVLRYHPDLTVVCFALNDCGQGEAGLPKYRAALEEIFTRLEESGSEIIFLTPNMMATEVSCHVTDPFIRKVAESVSENQVAGGLDRYVDAAKEICARRNIPVCDCYAKWKLLAASGVNTTELLANKINHPSREMNWLFAGALVETMLN